MQQQQTISGLDCYVQQKADFIWQPMSTSSVIGPRRSTKAFPKVKCVPKKRSWSLFGSLLPIGSTTAVRIPVKPLYLRSVLSKSMRCTQSCNACRQHWSTERAQFSTVTTPNHMSHNQCFKRWVNWSTKICLICHIHLTSHHPTTTSSRIWTTFYRGNASTTSRMHNMLYKSLWIPKHGVLCYRSKQTHF